MPQDNLNRLLQDYAARIEKLTKRVDRLETLEFSSAAFPSGGTACFDTVKLSAAVATVTLPQVGTIPSGFWHLWLWYTARVSSSTQPFLRFNGHSGATDYRSYKNVWSKGSGGQIMTSFGTAGGATDIDLMYAGITGGGNLERNGCEVNIYDYANTEFYKAVTWKGWAIDDFGEDPVINTIYKALGGGQYRKTNAITSLTLHLPGIITFEPGSVFTLIGICTKPPA